MKQLSLCVVAVLAAMFSLTSCDKIWEIGQKLKAPEPPDVALVLEEQAAGAIPPPPEAGELLEGGGLEEVEEPEEEGPAVDVEAQVSILGYHDFSESRGPTDMIIRSSKFREQMELLKNSEVPVIALSDYLAWKRGEKDVPSPSVVITIDDGWEGVYEEAFPVLQEFGFPFSIFLYKNYIGGGGRSLGYEEIREMMANGAEIGSHSVSHADMTRTSGRTAEQQLEWLREELGGSLRFLRENFGSAVLPVFAYPYGKYNQGVMDLAQEFGYELGVTVAPKKAAFTAPDLEVGRYIIHGDNDINFDYAMTFKGGASLAEGNLLSGPAAGAAGAAESGEEEPLVTMWPRQDETILTRKPRITVDLSKLGQVSRDGMSMTLSGFGQVPFEFDAEKGTVSFQVDEPLRSESCEVTLRLKRPGSSESEFVSWSFKIDRIAHYLQGPEEVEGRVGTEVSGGGGESGGEAGAEVP